MFFDREHSVEKTLDCLATVLELILHYSLRVGRYTFDHAAVGFRKVAVVFEEVDVPEHVGNHHLVLNRTVRFQ